VSEPETTPINEAASEPEEPKTAPKSEAQLKRDGLGTLIMMLLPMVLKQLYPDPDPLDEPDEKDDEAEREPIEEWSVTMAVVGDGGVADIPRPNGDGWLAYGHRVEPGSVTMLWRRERDAK